MERLLKTPKFDVIRKPIPSLEGRPLVREFVLHPGAVVILPMLEDGRCILIRQFRPAIDAELWELPAGTLDQPGESVEAAAQRELQEETGYAAQTLSFLCKFHPSPGILSEMIHAFVATGLSHVGQRLESGERINEVVPIPMSEAIEMIRRHEIIDGKTIITLLFRRLEQEPRR